MRIEAHTNYCRWLISGFLSGRLSELSIRRQKLNSSRLSSCLPWCCLPSSSCFHRRHLLTRQLAETLACSLPLSKLDYFNALLPGASSDFIGDLLRELSNIACIVTVGSESLEKEMHCMLNVALHIKWRPLPSKCAQQVSCSIWNPESKSCLWSRYSFPRNIVAVCSWRVNRTRLSIFCP